MKRLLSGLVIGGILSTCIFANAGPTNWTATKALFKVMVRGQEYVSETPPIVIESRTYLPLRAMGNVLGVSVEWNDKLKQAEVGMAIDLNDTAKTETALSDSEKAKWKNKSWKALKAEFKVIVRGDELDSEYPPVVVEGRTFLPLRVLGDALGVKVDWNDKLKQAEVDMGVTTTPEVTPIPGAMITTTPAATVTPAATPATVTPAATPTPAATATATPATSYSTSSYVAPAATPTPTKAPTPTPDPYDDWYNYGSTPAPTTPAPTTPAPTTPAPTTPAPTTPAPTKAPTAVPDPYDDWDNY
ncbi:copper amine oxidase N-terminal domain-containing protein [Pseudobacteroides cellulosolvens]|uniref:Copper amine oxidase-like domain-containing protein n=1 Tax=Pseudobacteroides cellulosolvens ATCC 35603 = DSM 2933 TaxID=398512 RepID=A0A0L6JL09_9FIRM|nr:copper amine oxidase N-terminal domain-containing protein [Pseudobacteroides cellulosolvens]KNY26408.1 copper amine oxidase-like domain-containing protein [Pseudobacteroides cellulosolvens ATCC 35603 = DSM 2933]